MADDESSYQAHWAALTGRSPSAVYVPEALRESWDCTWCGKPQTDAPMATCSATCLEAEIEWANQR